MNIEQNLKDARTKLENDIMLTCERYMSFDVLDVKNIPTAEEMLDNVYKYNRINRLLKKYEDRRIADKLINAIFHYNGGVV